MHEVELTDELATQLMKMAREATTHAYAPYSNFPVGAALLCANGEIITGCNVENASYGLTCCAERIAVFTAAARGHREFTAVAVAATRVLTAPPCGACRQVLNEFKPTNGELIVLLDAAGPPIRVPLSSLLPNAFGPKDLE
jgi:cytidine deaminase